MKLLNHLFFLSLFLPFLMFSQQESIRAHDDESITIQLNPYDQQESRGFLILYPITSLGDSLKRQLNYPDLSTVQDTAFAEIYFTGNNEKALPNTVMTIIGNYYTTSPTFWIDYNNDLDFIELQNPILFTDDSIEVHIPDIQNKSLHHSIRFYKPDSTNYQRTDSILTKHITGGKHVAFYFDQRLNIRVGDIIYKDDSMRIGVMDHNVNGAYDDLNRDRIVFGNYMGKIHGTDKASGAIVLGEANYFKEHDETFDVQHIEADGSSIRIVPVDEKKSFDRVKKGETIANFKIELLNGEEANLHDLLNGENYLYLNFWASWCAGCHMEMESLAKVATHDSIHVLSLNYNENLETIERFIDKHQPSWIQGRSTDKINRKLMIEGLPRNILIAPDGRILEMNIHPTKLLE